MSRTYWAERPDKTFEFQGAFRDGHVAPKNSPQAAAKILDVTDRDVAGMEAALRLSERDAGPPVLAGLPTALLKRWQARMPITAPWAQIEGLVK